MEAHLDTEATARIRPAHPEDIPQVLAMIELLAAHHGDTATTKPETLMEDAFGNPPWIRILVAEAADRLTGYAIVCPLYLAQYGQRGVDLHHLFVPAGSEAEGHRSGPDRGRP